MLLNCNALSESRLKTTQEDFKQHVKMIGEMKKDLDFIFKKIRTIKAKLSTQYPDAQVQEAENEDEEETDRVGQKKDDSQVEYEQMVHSPQNTSQGWLWDALQ